MRSPIPSRVGLLLAAALVLSAPVFAQTIVPGSSNPFLAGMPNGSSCCSGDSAPLQSPVLAPGSLTPGTSLTFAVTGGVDNTGAPPTLPPDGGGCCFSTSSNNGIAGANWPINALVGVFLDASQPNLTPAPSPLDFSPSGVGTNFTSLSPGLKQAFFIGDGLTGNGSGSVQNFIIPAGATRLFLGTSDGVGWFNNSGSFSVTVGAGVGIPTPTPTVAPPTATPTVSAAVVPTLSLPMLAILSLALAGLALLLIRRS